MRDLYMYYKRLKQQITRQAQGGKASRSNSNNKTQGSNGNSQLSINMSADSGNKVSNPEDSSEEQKILRSLDGSGSNMSNEAVKMKYGVTNKLEAQKLIQDVKVERKKLRSILDDFQKNFMRQNNRKIRFTKDVAPISAEFKRYKDLKGDLSNLEFYVNPTQ